MNVQDVYYQATSTRWGMLEGGDGLPLRIMAQRGALTPNLRGEATECSIEPKRYMIGCGLWQPRGMGVLMRLGSHLYDARFGHFATRLPLAALVVSIMLLLKLHYSSATAEQLRWILGPTARLTGWFTAANPVWEAGIGYADFAHGIIVAPACAGINFMIMAFGATALCGLYHLESPKRQAVWVIAALAASYAIALPVNTVRIALSLLLYGADMEYGWFTAARIHRMAGVVLYFGALWIYVVVAWHGACAFAGTGDRCPRDRPSRLAAWTILGWYVLGAIGVPLINGAWRNGLASFVEHSLTVGSVALVVFLAAVLMRDALKATFWSKEALPVARSHTGSRAMAKLRM